MKTFRLTSLILIGTLFLQSGVYAAVDCNKSKLSEDEINECCSRSDIFDQYMCKVNAICKKGDWSDTKDALIKFADPPYGKIESITEKSFPTNYFKYMQGLGISKDAILAEIGSNTIDGGQSQSSPFLPIDAFDLAKIAYRETMNGLYKCAILNAKIVTIGHIQKIKPSDQSALMKKLKQEDTQYRQQITKLGCRITVNTNEPDPSVNLKLLNNTTYQQCIYRFYLEEYLIPSYKNNYSAFLQNNNGTDSNTDSVKALFNKVNSTQKIISFFGNKTDEVNREVDQSKRVYRQAFASYKEFERTYEMHLWLTFIFEDFINLRNNLRKLINPIGQLIYKISNAQSPGN